MSASKEAKSAADKAKEDGFQPMYTVVAGQEFVFRGVTRSEWRELLDRRNAKVQEAGEDPVKQAAIQEDEMEHLCQIATIFPSEFDNEKMGAGTVQALSDAILIESGFAGPEVEPVRL